MQINAHKHLVECSVKARPRKCSKVEAIHNMIPLFLGIPSKSVLKLVRSETMEIPPTSSPNRPPKTRVWIVVVEWKPIVPLSDPMAREPMLTRTRIACLTSSMMDVMINSKNSQVLRSLVFVSRFRWVIGECDHQFAILNFEDERFFDITRECVVTIQPKQAICPFESRLEY